MIGVVVAADEIVFGRAGPFERRRRQPGRQQRREVERSHWIVIPLPGVPRSQAERMLEQPHFPRYRTRPILCAMAKSPDRPAPPKHRDPAKHSKKDPAKPTRAKAARPDSAPLDPALADLLNPAIGRGRAGVGSQTGLDEKKRAPSTPSPLRGRVGVGGREVMHAEHACRTSLHRRASPPDPHP